MTELGVQAETPMICPDKQQQARRPIGLNPNPALAIAGTLPMAFETDPNADINCDPGCPGPQTVPRPFGDQHFWPRVFDRQDVCGMTVDAPSEVPVRLVARAKAYEAAQDGFAGGRSGLKVHGARGEYVGMMWSAVKAVGWGAVAGWRSTALTRTYNREKPDIDIAAQHERGGTRAMAEAIIAKNAR